MPALRSHDIAEGAPVNNDTILECLDLFPDEWTTDGAQRVYSNQGLNWVLTVRGPAIGHGPIESKFSVRGDSSDDAWTNLRRYLIERRLDGRH